MHCVGAIAGAGAVSTAITAVGSMLLRGEAYDRAMAMGIGLFNWYCHFLPCRLVLDPLHCRLAWV